MKQEDFKWEIIKTNKDAKTGEFKHVIFDFDGTISLIREGWQKIMIPYFTDELQNTPKGKDIEKKELKKLATDFIFLNTGKQTIYQCFQLQKEIEKLGGTPLEAQDYKDEYHARLTEKIKNRIKGLESGSENIKDHVVPGSIELLDALKEQGVTMYLASGTDEVYVKQEAELLGVTKYFKNHIYGAQTDYKTFSKKMIIDKIIKDNNLSGSELLGFGDGYVEIENLKSVDGFACGVATDEQNRWGFDEWKVDRLTSSGADIIIPDFTNTQELMDYLF